MAAENLLNKVIKDLAAQISTLSDAIQGTAGDTQGRDFSRKIADRMQEQYNIIQERAKIAGENFNIEKELQDTLGKILEEEKKSSTLAEKLENVYKEAVKKGLKGLDLSEKINKDFAEILKDVNAYKKVMTITVEQALQLSKNDLTNMLRKLDSFGFIGKIGKIVATAMIGGPDSARRKGIERGMAIKMHPETFGGENAKGLGALFGDFAKFAAIIAITYPIIKGLFDNFLKIAAISANIVKSTGFAEVNISKMKDNILKSSVDLKYYNIEMEQLYAAAGSLANEFKNVDQVSEDAINTIAIMSKMTGISSDQLARLYRIMAVNWRMTDKSIRSFNIQLRDEAKVYGLSFSNIMQDITANAENLTMYFHGSVKELKEAAVRAAQMQSSLSTQVGIAQKFSHWADAIQNSFMLSAITGKQFNAAFLYTNAALGNTKVVVDKIMESLSSSADDWKKIVPMAQQVSQTLGVPFEEINTMMENKTLEKMLSGLGIGAQQMGHAIKAVRDISASTGSDAFTVAKGLKNNMAELTQKMSESMALEQRLKAGREGKDYKQAQAFAEALGIPEIMSPQEKLLASIAGTLNQLSTWVIGPFAKLFEQVADRIINPFNFLKASPGTTEEAQARVDKWRAEQIAKGVKPWEVGQNPAQMQAEKNIGMFGMQGFNANGGIVSSPSIAGEAGPEAILPLTGPGKKSFTEPFLANTMTPLVNEIKEAIANLTRVPIQVKVYLDTEVVGEKLEKYAYMQAVR